MESNYTEAELNHNDQWDKWGRYKEMSNKDLTTCFNGNKHILSTRTSLRLLRVPDDGQSLPETACLLSTALMPGFFYLPLEQSQN